jgi:hypothetical protein
VCSTHQAVCVVDQQAHCARHLLATDASQRLVCAKHRAGCAEEPGAVFAMDEVAPCPVCGRYVCGGHRVVCGSCGRAVCTADVAQPSGHCSTCEQLVAVADPPPEALTAARAATPHEATPAGTWRTARDQTHLVAELDRGTGGRSVFWLRRGESTPEGVVTHAPDGQSAP